jgi:hypothetical protein
VLRPLSLAPLEPQQHSSRGHILSAFKKIDTIRVVLNCTATSDDGKYVVEVFSGQLRSHIPTINNHGTTFFSSVSSSPSPASRRRPTSTTTKSLDDFAELRLQLFNIAHYSHRKDPCVFCRTMNEYALLANALPNAVARFFGEEEKTLQSLTKFLGDLVPLVETGDSTATGGSLCRAQARTSSVVHEFLFGRSSESS